MGAEVEMSGEQSTHPVISYPFGAGGVVTRVLECGDGSNTVVCLHGAGSRADRWRRNLPGLAESGYHVYALDYPGHGFATKDPAYEHGVPRYAEVVTDFVNQLGTEGVALLGTSIGGHIAAWVACEIPTKIRAAVLIGAVGIVAPQRTSAVDSGRVSNTSQSGVRDKLEFLVFDKELVTEAWVNEESRINSSPGAADSLARLRKYLEQERSSDIVGERYAALGLPTMLVWGADDRWVPVDVGRETAALLPKAPFVLIEQAGHAPYYERPDAFNEVALEFLDDPASCPPGIRRV
jgi:2-hydroxy-6-oxonona-2,4-dienedioate hydrolase